MMRRILAPAACLLAVTAGAQARQLKEASGGDFFSSIIAAASGNQPASGTGAVWAGPTLPNFNWPSFSNFNGLTNALLPPRLPLPAPSTIASIIAASARAPASLAGQTAAAANAAGVGFGQPQPGTAAAAAQGPIPAVVESILQPRVSAEAPRAALRVAPAPAPSLRVAPAPAPSLRAAAPAPAFAKALSPEAANYAVYEKELKGAIDAVYAREYKAYKDSVANPSLADNEAFAAKAPAPMALAAKAPAPVAFAARAPAPAAFAAKAPAPAASQLAPATALEAEAAPVAAAEAEPLAAKAQTSKALPIKTARTEQAVRENAVQAVYREQLSGYHADNAAKAFKAYTEAAAPAKSEIYAYGRLEVSAAQAALSDAEAFARAANNGEGRK